MTLFEYLAVFLSIVLSFGVVRLLDGLPSALRRGRRYAIHSLWIISVLFMHVQFWWAFWSFTGVTWNYPRFLIVLANPFLLYSLAITLVPREADTVESWRDHFYLIRTRFFLLYSCWWVVIMLGNTVVLGQPLLNGLRVLQATFFGLYLAGAVTRRPLFHSLLVAFSLVVGVLSVASLFLEPASLDP